MNLVVLDYYFPFFIMAYGFIMTVLLNSDWSQKLISEKLPAELGRQFMAHKALGLFSLVIGMLWSLQNIWLGEPPL